MPHFSAAAFSSSFFFRHLRLHLLGLFPLPRAASFAAASSAAFASAAAFSSAAFFSASCSACVLIASRFAMYRSTSDCVARCTDDSSSIASAAGAGAYVCAGSTGFFFRHVHCRFTGAPGFGFGPPFRFSRSTISASARLNSSLSRPPLLFSSYS